ncbi:PLP-dependent transferase [Thermomonas flagellata]|uniref:PLP-dependent transferase n=1 Tax=Thermomonas flagellata TaxID=2888524 RepID=UPI001F049DCD|nr:PLP-dependent transferase [Thermomonas flagellata]
MSGFSTLAIHHGYDPQAHHGALVPPTYHSATFAFPGAEAAARAFAGEGPGYVYTRIGNPTLALFEARMAALEGGAAAVAFGSGMGAITSTLWTLLRPGDLILADRTLYGCTFAFLHHGIGQFGVRVRQVDMTDPAALADGLRERPRLVYLESPANPNMRLIDIAAVAAAAHAAGALVAVDNTYATPYLQQPLALGADVVLHSATKYLSGHGDATAGVMVARDAELAAQVRLQGLKDMTGAVLSPADASLLLRGLKTLALRMDRHCANARALAGLLHGHPAVARVYYPGLADDPFHALAARQMRQPGGMLAFELHGGVAAGRRFIDALQLVACAVSLGDAESLAQHPASMTHSTYTPEERAAAGIGEGLVRLSAGLEDAPDLLEDVARALQAAAG